MRLVVAGTSPLRYLVQIDQIDLLPPRPDWLEVSVVSASDDPSLGGLDEGEKPAIALGLSLSADLVLIDDRRGAAVARGRGFEVTGTLGILDLAARRGMVDLADALARLRTTNFRRREALLKGVKRWDSQPISQSRKSVAVVMIALRSPKGMKTGTGRRVHALRLGNMRAVPGFGV